MLQNCNIYPVHANFAKSSKRAFAKCNALVKLYLFCKGCINFTPFKQINPSICSYCLIFIYSCDFIIDMMTETQQQLLDKYTVPAEVQGRHSLTTREVLKMKNDVTNLTTKDLNMLVWILNDIQVNPRSALAQDIKRAGDTERLAEIKRAISRTAYRMERQNRGEE